MAKGVKKIEWNSTKKDGAGVYPKLSTPNRLLTIEPDKHAWFSVKEWYPDTTKAEKEKNITWIRQDGKEKFIIKQMVVPANNLYGFRLEKKLCGPYTYYIEASLSGKRDLKNETGLYVRGYCTPKIIDSKWCTSNDGKDERSRLFSYGEKLYLGVNTEGLNGNILTVEIYRLREGSRLTGRKEDKRIRTIANVEVIDGEINLEINNTSLWKADIIDIEDTEKFYIKIKDAFGNYIKDDKNDNIHARFLRIKNESVPQTPKKPTNNTPVKVGESEVNKKRDELCKFSAINITETQKKDGKDERTKVEIYKEGQALNGNKTPQELIHRTIFFDFDQHTLTEKSKEALDNVLNFLLDNQYSIISIDGYACIIGKSQYNKELSLKRSEAVKKHFVDGGLDARRIRCIGKGEIQLNDGKIVGQENDEKRDGDNIAHKDEKNYIEARRVDISFLFIGHDAKTIVYETIAPSQDKEILVEVGDYQTKACIAQEKHKVLIKATSAEYKGRNGLSKEGNSMKVPIHSALAWWNVAPLQYIWPASTTPTKYFLDIHSCRYFSNDKNSTVLVKAYPDIKWKLDFFLNLTNDLSVKWMNMDPYEHKELQKRAGKMGAEKRWKQKDASLGFSLKAKWNDDKQEKELKYEYEAKFKKIYDLFSSIGALSDGITNKTKGTMRSVSPKGIPVSFAVKPPNLSLAGDWFLAHPKNDDKIIGTDLAIALNANPLIGLEITVDLLGALVFGVAGVISGGTAADGVTRLYNIIQGKLKKGIEVGNEENGLKANIDIYMDLIISSTISIGSEFKFNTAGKLNDSKFKVESESKLKVELKVGIKIKGEAVVAIIKVEAYFEASAAGNASVTFGHGVNYDDKGLYYRPKLGFDGLHAEYVIQISASLAVKIAKDKNKVEESRGGKYTIAEGNYKNIIPPFDVIEELEKLFKMSANIPLIKNN